MLKLSKPLSLCLVALAACVATGTPSIANQHNYNGAIGLSTVQPGQCGNASSQLTTIPGTGRTPFLVQTADYGTGIAGTHWTLPNVVPGLVQGSVTTNNIANMTADGIATLSDGSQWDIPFTPTFTPTPNTIKGKTGAGNSALWTIDLAQAGIMLGWPAGSTVKNFDFYPYNFANSNPITVYLDQPTYNGVPIPKNPTNAGCTDFEF